MKKILGYTINENKKVPYALKSLYGIGFRLGLNICKHYNINPNLKWKNLSSRIHYLLSNYIEKQIPIGKDIRSIQKENIDKLIKNKSNKGFRHLKKLPLRGQRTHSNAKTFKNMSKVKKKKTK